MNNKMMVLMVLAMMAVPLGLVADPSKVSFPDIAEAPDRSGRYAIIWSDSKPHDLFFKDLKGGEDRHLLTFNRHVDVFWSPDGNAFAVTDWAGSDYSDVVVYSILSLSKPTKVQDALERSFGSLPEVQNNGHVYFEAQHWVNSRLLRFRFHAYGDYNPVGFEKVFEYSLKEGRVKGIQ